MINRINEDFDWDSDFTLENVVIENNRPAVGTSTFRSFIMTEKSDEAYNNMINNMLCQEIRNTLGEIYIATPDSGRAHNRIKLIRRGKGGAYQFELKINTDGTVSVVDNSLARGFIKTMKDGSRKFIMLNAETFYTTTKTMAGAVSQIVEWLSDNYDAYEPANAAARDRSAGINPDVAHRATITRRQGPKRTTDAARTHGITNVSDFLRRGGNIKDLIG